MANDTLLFNCSAEHLDGGDQRLKFFDLAGILDIAPEDAELKTVQAVSVTLAASESNVEVPLPAGMTTGKLLCIKTSDSITVKRNSTSGEALPIGKWKSTKPGGCLIGPTSFTSLYISNSVAREVSVEVLIGGV